jgi:hypothetical protein
MGPPFGIVIGKGKDGALYVVDVRSGSSGARAGVRRGWVLLACEEASSRSRIRVSQFIAGNGRASALPNDVVCLFEDDRRRQIAVWLSGTDRYASPSSNARFSPKDKSNTGSRGRGLHNGSHTPLGDPAARRAPRPPPRRYSESPVSSLPMANTGSPVNRGRWLGPLLDLIRPRIESIKPGSSEAAAAYRRVWRGWKAVRDDEAIIMRKEYPPECVLRLRIIQRHLRHECLGAIVDAWQALISNRRSELLCSVRILKLSVRDVQSRAFSTWFWISKESAKSRAEVSSAQPRRSGVKEQVSSMNAHEKSAPSHQRTIAPEPKNPGLLPAHTESYPIEPATSLRVPDRSGRPQEEPTPFRLKPETGTDSQSPEHGGARSWFFGLFGSTSPTKVETKNDTSSVSPAQQPALVQVPELPAHVTKLWPDLDLDSYMVHRTDRKDTSSKDKKAETEVLRAREKLRQAQSIHDLMVASRERFQKLQSRYKWLNAFRSQLVVKDQQIARRLLEQNGFNSAQAIAAFMSAVVGTLSAQRFDLVFLKQRWRIWRILAKSQRLREELAEQWRKKLTRKNIASVLQQWRAISRRKRYLRRVLALLSSKHSCLLSQNIFAEWKEAAQRGCCEVSHDEGLIERAVSPDTARSLNQLMQLSCNAGRAVMGDRGVAAGVSVASVLGQLVLGADRFQSLLASFSPPPASAPSRQGSPKRAATESPPRGSSWGSLTPTQGNVDAPWRAPPAPRNRAMSQDRSPGLLPLRLP